MSSFFFEYAKTYKKYYWTKCFIIIQNDHWTPGFNWTIAFRHGGLTCEKTSPHITSPAKRLERVQTRATIIWLREWRATTTWKDWEFWVWRHWKRDLLGQIWLRFIRLSMVWTAWDPGRYFVWDVGVTREHSFKLFKKRVSLDVGMYKVGNRVCNEWNLLTEDGVLAGSVNTFKARLDHHLRNVRGFV